VVGVEKWGRVRGESPWTVHALLARLRVKDHLIRCLADQLRSDLDLDLTSSFLTMLHHDPPHTFDFTRTSLCQYLHNRNNPTTVDILQDGGGGPSYCSGQPLLVTRLQPLDSHSLYLTWTQPSSNNVSGFQIEVEGQQCERIYSAGRRCALLSPVTLPLTLTVRAFDHSGHVIQQHSLTYPPPPPH